MAVVDTPEKITRILDYMEAVSDPKGAIDVFCQRLMVGLIQQKWIPANSLPGTFIMIFSFCSTTYSVTTITSSGSRKSCNSTSSCSSSNSNSTISSSSNFPLFSETLLLFFP